VEAHGWELRVDSELGHGSVFAVVLPIVPQAPGRASTTVAA
jgi:signal transduction histidine kinase